MMDETMQSHHKAKYDASNTTVEELLCSICKWDHTGQRNKVGMWTAKPCTLLRRDILQCQRNLSRIKKQKTWKLQAGIKERWRNQASYDCSVLAKRKALIGALQMMCWLAKELIPPISRPARLRLYM